MFQRKNLASILSFCLVLCITQASTAQYFGNNAFQIPFIGWMGFDSTSGKMLEEKNQQAWQTTDQVQVGFGYMRTIMPGYGLWYTMQTGLGFGYAKEHEQTSSKIIIGLNVASGLRYNFLEKRQRPFISAQLEYLQFFNIDPVFGRAFWIGLLLGPGYEWIFADSMGIQIDTGAHVLSDFFNPARITWTARLSYMLYF